MTDEFYFFSNDSNNWNYNPFINPPNADPYNLKRTINISSNNSYNLMKYNAVIMLKEILNHTIGGVRAEPLYEVNFLFFYFL